MSRETIYQALFTLASGAANFVTTSRRWKHWGDVDAASQPALFQNQKGEHVVAKNGLPAQRKLLVDLCLYASNGDPNLAGSSFLNPLLDAVEAALAPDPATERQTLGGLVSHAFINGAVEIFEGVIGDQAVAIVPVEILIP
jgi:hypothetical protein